MFSSAPMNPSTSVLHSATASVAGIDVLVVVVAVVVVAVVQKVEGTELCGKTDKDG